jgi:hypothetical protein
MASPDSLRMAIQALHAAISEHSSAQGKATLAACLAQMMSVQAKITWLSVARRLRSSWRIRGSPVVPKGARTA